MFVNATSYGCSCSCCAGCACALNYLGTLTVPTCASTTCADACRATYTACSTGITQATCKAKNIFNFYSSFILIILTFIFILLNRN